MSFPTHVATSVYLEVAPVKRGATVMGAKVIRSTKTPPALAPGNIAVRVDLTLPFEAFHPLSVGAVVEPSRVTLAAEHGEAVPS
jgi:hypothetical protein